MYSLLPLAAVSGNQPSNTILREQITPLETAGQSGCHVNTKVFVAGHHQGLNSFRSVGVECAQPTVAESHSLLAGEQPSEDMTARPLVWSISIAGRPWLIVCIRWRSSLGKTMLSRGWVLATAESCTGGGIGAAITAVPGSSVWFDGGVISYSNRAKQCLLG